MTDVTMLIQYLIESGWVILPLAVVLFLFGFFGLKPTAWVPDQLIPLILMVLGGIIAIPLNGVADVHTTTQTVLQGIASGGAAVIFHQVAIKQLPELFKNIKKSNNMG